ncbi:MAG: hypothetical protein WBD59_08405 [Candidatus Sulfotelmatobacter sp.]
MFEVEIVRLAKAVRDEVLKYKAQGRILTERQVLIRRRDYTLLNVADHAFANIPPMRVEEEEWDWENLGSFQSSKLETLDEYKALASALEANGLTRSVQFIQNFLRGVATESLRGLCDEELHERVLGFKRDLENLPKRIDITAFIDGISITESPIDISDHFTLRLPVSEDVMEDAFFDQYGGFSFPKNQTWFRVVGELKFDVVSTGEAQTELMRIICALRLFRVGGVRADRFKMTVRHSYVNPGGAILESRAALSNCFYAISRADALPLKQFLEDIPPRLPGLFFADKGLTPKEIAYLRYNEAIFQDGPAERTITAAVIVLEALFLTTEPELRHRLAQRVSVFLKVLGSQPDALHTYDCVSRGYSIRSTFIHGGSLRAKDRPEANQLMEPLLEYARVSVLAFFQISISKLELLKQLDRAMLDGLALTKLERLLDCVRHK